MRGFWNSLERLNSTSINEVLNPVGYSLVPVKNPEGTELSVYNVFDSNGDFVKTSKYPKNEVFYNPSTLRYEIQLPEEDLEYRTKALDTYISACKKIKSNFELVSVHKSAQKVRAISNSVFEYPVVSGLESDLVESYLVLGFNPINSRNGFSLDLVTNRLVCSNGMRIPGSSEKFTIKNLNEDVITTALEKLQEKTDKFKTIGERLAEIQLSEDEAYKYLTIGLKGKLDSDYNPIKLEDQSLDVAEIYSLWKDGQVNGKPSLGWDLASQQHTGFGLIQATTEYYQHISPKVNEKHSLRQNSNAIFNSVMSGYGAKQVNSLMRTVVKTQAEANSLITPLVTF